MRRPFPPLLAALTLAATSAAAPPPAAEAPDVFVDLSLVEGRRLAEERVRLLVVYIYHDGEPETAAMDERTWTSPLVRSYLLWHCVAIKAEAGANPALLRWLDLDDEDIPAVAVLRDGKVEALTKTLKHPFNLDVFDPANTMPGGPRRPGPTRIFPPPLNVLFQTDFALERIRATDPVWAARHDLKNPPPPPPAAPDPWHTVDDGLGAVVRDPEPPAPNASPGAPPAPPPALTILDRLDEARRADADGMLHAATGLYTWLWERASALDPAFAAARRSALAADMRDLARRRPGARERFTKIRDGLGARLLWFDHADTVAWATLNAVIDDQATTLSVLDLFTNDRDESSLLPPEDAAAFAVLTRRTDFADAWELPADPVRHATWLLSRADLPKPRHVAPETWDSLRAFFRSYALEEGARLYTACLVHARDPDAEAIARALLARHDDPLTRRTLVTTALCARPPQARPVHLRWLDEAAAEPGADAAAIQALRKRVAALLGPSGIPVSE